MMLIAPETYRTAQEELSLFGGSILLGIPAGLLFDILKLFRRIVPHSIWFTALEDILFLTAVSLLLLCYTGSIGGGEFRFYELVGCFGGFFLYEFLCSRFVFRLWDCFARICKKLMLNFVKYTKK